MRKVITTIHLEEHQIEYFRRNPELGMSKTIRMLLEKYVIKK